MNRLKDYLSIADLDAFFQLYGASWRRLPAETKPPLNQE